MGIVTCCVAMRDSRTSQSENSRANTCCRVPCNRTSTSQYFSLYFSSTLLFLQFYLVAATQADMPILTTIRQSPAYLYVKTYCLCAIITLFQAAPVSSRLPYAGERLQIKLETPGTITSRLGSRRVSIDRHETSSARQNEEVCNTGMGGFLLSCLACSFWQL